jgi:hypothetical protein
MRQSTVRRPKRKVAAKPSRNGRATKVEHVRLSTILRSPENDSLYRPINRDDPDIIALANSIREHGILEPLIVTADGFIVSGHRRCVAASIAGLDNVPIRRVRVRRAANPDAFLRLLREHNRQRDKTNAEKLREELASVDTDDAHAELWRYRREQAAIDMSPLKVGHVRLRKSISIAKVPMLRAVHAIVQARRQFWPLSDRQIHYALLSDPPLRHASKPNSIYQNDRNSYGDLCDLLTRARLDVGLAETADPLLALSMRMPSIPFEAIGDETRPVEIWDVHQSVRPFVRRELDGMFKSYWRDLMQSQANHIELVGEKNTVAPILKPIAAEYTIPLTIGRGYCSLAPRHAMAERFRDSGKQMLVLLIASDFDPEGEDIAQSFARSMRDDFDIDQIHPIKVALTADQVKKHNLPPIMQAKATSSRYKKFVRQHGKNVFELEALPPETLQQIVRSGIEGVIDRHAFAAEIAAERNDAGFLVGVRRTVCEALQGIDLGGGNDE